MSIIKNIKIKENGQRIFNLNKYIYRFQSIELFIGGYKADKKDYIVDEYELVWTGDIELTTKHWLHYIIRNDDEDAVDRLINNSNIRSRMTHNMIKEMHKEILILKKHVHKLTKQEKQK